MFKTHDLDGLLLYTGLAAALEDEVLVCANFRQVVGLWNDENGEAVVRYRNPSSVDSDTARTFLDCLMEAPEGFIPWLQKAIS